MKPAFLSEQDIEQRAASVLRQYERQTGTVVQEPVPIDDIVDVTLDVPILWRSIPAVRGSQPAGKFVQPTLGKPACIVLNEDLLDTVFAATPGFEHTTLAHEAGHAVLHREPHRSQQLDLGLVLVEPTREIVSTVSDLEGGLQRAIALRGPAGDDYWREWQAFTFMRYILMPRPLIQSLLIGNRFLNWSGPGSLYDLRDRFGVTISALVMHLSKLGFIEVDEHRRIHDRRASAVGQRSLT
jgi:hypothetical protein